MSKGKYECTVCEEDHSSGCMNLVCIIGYHNCASMSPDAVEDATDPLDAERTRWCQLGHVAEQEDQTKLWRQRSGEAFAAGNDAEANFYRKLAVDTEASARKTRDEYMQKYNPKFAR